MTDTKIVHRDHHGLRAWCLCSECSARHASNNKRRTKHDRWAWTVRTGPSAKISRAAPDIFTESVALNVFEV
jgi:hypothetical protein